MIENGEREREGEGERCPTIELTTVQVWSLNRVAFSGWGCTQLAGAFRVLRRARSAVVCKASLSLSPSSTLIGRVGCTFLNNDYCDLGGLPVPCLPCFLFFSSLFLLASLAGSGLLCHYAGGYRCAGDCDIIPVRAEESERERGGGYLVSFPSPFPLTETQGHRNTAHRLSSRGIPVSEQPIRVCVQIISGIPRCQ